jgi:hypothetical protein
MSLRIAWSLRIACGVLIITAAVSAQQPPDSKSTAAAIEGRVLTRSGEPLSNALVIVRPIIRPANVAAARRSGVSRGASVSDAANSSGDVSQDFSAHSAHTDKTGHFSISDLNSEEVIVSAEASGYLRQFFGAAGLMKLQKGQTVKGVIFTWIRRDSSVASSWMETAISSATRKST